MSKTQALQAIEYFDICKPLLIVIAYDDRVDYDLVQDARSSKSQNEIQLNNYDSEIAMDCDNRQQPIYPVRSIAG